MLRSRLSVLAPPRRPWSPYATASLHLDFINRRYFWGGRERLPSDFKAWAGAVLTPRGILGNGDDASYDIQVDWAATGIAAPFALLTAYTVDTLDGAAQTVCAVDTDGSNLAFIGVTASTNNHQAQITATAVLQSNQNNQVHFVGQRTCAGINFETNNILQSVDGATGAAADTVATLPALAQLRVLKRSSGAGLKGVVHHVIIVPGAQTQTALNTLTGAIKVL
jgi:hypothetical protein